MPHPHAGDTTEHSTTATDVINYVEALFTIHSRVGSRHLHSAVSLALYTIHSRVGSQHLHSAVYTIHSRVGSQHLHSAVSPVETTKSRKLQFIFENMKAPIQATAQSKKINVLSPNEFR